MLFPQGLAYDIKEHYRTPKVNSVFGCVADLSKLLKENKNGTYLFLEESPASAEGLDLLNFLTDF